MLRRTSKKVKKLNTYTLFFIIVAQLAFKSRMVQKQLHSQLEKRNPSILKCYNFDAHICTQRGQTCQPRREDQCENWKWGKIFLEYLLVIRHMSRLNSGNYLTLFSLKIHSFEGEILLQFHLVLILFSSVQVWMLREWRSGRYFQYHYWLQLSIPIPVPLHHRYPGLRRLQGKFVY